MRRREFITLLGGTATMWPLTMRAQQRVPRIGVLLVISAELMGPYRETLRDLGHVEGKNIQFEVRSAQGQVSRLPELAAELVRSRVDIIVASLTPAVIAARHATSDIPIIMAPAGDPVGTGLISSLARPGGNITGISGSSPELGAKSLELIREFVPGAHRVAYLRNANDPLARLMLEQAQLGAQTTNFVIHPVVIRESSELDGAFAQLALERIDAVILSGTLPIQRQVDLAMKHRLPTLQNQTTAARAGALISYSASHAERSRQVANYVDKILKGEKPADLPVQQPSKFELVVNLKTAKALGLTISPTLLARADEVIE
jgi:putative ABC transport system substrate-binding protein